MHIYPHIPFAPAMNLPDNVAFTVAGFDVYWAGLLLSAGVIATILIAQYEAGKKRLPADTAVDLCILGIPFGVVFARIVYVLAHLSYYKATPLSTLYFWDGGLSLYGACLGVLAGVALYSLKKKLSFLRLTDLLVPGVLVTQALATWGDFFNQTGYGLQVANLRLQWFPFAVLIEKPESIRYAIFFYEFLFCTLLFAAIWFFVRRNAKRDGAASLWYLLIYPLGYAAFEMLRVDGAAQYGTFGTLQIVCVVLSVLSLVLLVLRTRRPVPAGDAAVSAGEVPTAPADKPFHEDSSAETVPEEAMPQEDAIESPGDLMLEETNPNETEAAAASGEFSDKEA
jgi:phosphatidylglycerol:prolipoprotein diacylglycerol transferase